MSTNIVIAVTTSNIAYQGEIRKTKRQEVHRRNDFLNRINLENYLIY